MHNQIDPTLTNVENGKRLGVSEATIRRWKQKSDNKDEFFGVPNEIITSRGKSVRLDLDSDTSHRFYSYVDKTLWGCWLWTGRKDRDGYGLFYLLGKTRRAHRVSYSSFYNTGMHPSLVIDHVCRVRSCVNPEHMDLVSARENTLRGSGITSKYRKALRCKNGHEFTVENTYVSAAGRHCKPCKIARSCVKIECPVCGKFLARGGMRAHVRGQHEV